MPTLHLYSNALPRDAHCTALAQALTKLTATVLRKRPEVTAVMFHDLPSERWYIDSVAQRHAVTVRLSIDVTAGTNTPQEKADFIAQAWHVLGQHLGAGAALAPASYVLVQEWPAGDWGYAGLSQAARRATSQHPA